MPDPAPNPLQPLVTQITRLACRIEELLLKIGNGGNGTVTTVVVEEKKATQAEGRHLTIGTTAILICPANPKRISVSIYNSGAVTVFIGSNKNVTSGAGSQPGFDLVSSGTVYDDKYTGEVYGIVAAGTSVIAIWEEIE